MSSVVAAASRRSQIDTVQLRVASGKFGTVPKSPRSKWSAPPNLPSSIHCPPARVPSRYIELMDMQDHVLVVDDDAEIRGLLHDYLKKNGYRVSAVADGQNLVDHDFLANVRSNLFYFDFCAGSNARLLATGL